jgi:hypothetical protein
MKREIHCTPDHGNNTLLLRYSPDHVPAGFAVKKGAEESPGRAQKVKDFE